jgi:hypothetical protein
LQGLVTNYNMGQDLILGYQIMTQRKDTKAISDKEQDEIRIQYSIASKLHNQPNLNPMTNLLSDSRVKLDQMGKVDSTNLK